MIIEKINLKEKFNGLENNAQITAYIPDNSQEVNPDFKRSTIIICPGGGYGFLSEREAEPVALRFVSEGYNAVVIKYSIAPVKYPNAHIEVAAAIAFVRKNADEWNVDVNKVLVCGFSAGGHLAATAGILWEEDYISEALKIDKTMAKPNAMILCYPVISSGIYAHRGSFENLLGKDAPQELIDSLSLENRVTQTAPPAFIWHTTDDGAVPSENALLLALALKKNNISVELHLYRKGVHGLSLCNNQTARQVEHGENPLISPHVGTWFALCTEWIEEIFEG